MVVSYNPDTNLQTTDTIHGAPQKSFLQDRLPFRSVLSGVGQPLSNSRNGGTDEFGNTLLLALGIAPIHLHPSP